MRYTQPQSGPISIAENWLARRLKFALMPAGGFFNCAAQAKAIQSSGPLIRSVSTSGQTVEPGARAEFPSTIDITKGVTIISIWRARVGGDYLGADGERDILSTRTGGNQGWTWGRNNAIGGGATGNLTSQVLTFQGVAQYIEGNATIEAFVDTPVACRYNPVTGKVSWFRFGAQSSADTTVGTPTIGGTLVVGAQGDYASSGNPWLDRYSALLIFESALSDAEIKQLSGSAQAVWQVVKSPQRAMRAASAGPDVTIALTGLANTAAAGNLVPSTVAAVSGKSAAAVQGGIAPAVAIALPGQASSAQQGLLTPARAIAIGGLSSTTAAGTVGPAIASALTGQASATQRGVLAPSGNITVALTGQSASVAQGALTRTTLEAVFALATIMRQSAIAVQGGTMKSTVAAQGGTLKATIALATIMRQSQINTKAMMTNVPINRTVAFL